jgi:hypothetical protein
LNLEFEIARAAIRALPSAPLFPSAQSQAAAFENKAELPA